MTLDVGELTKALPKSLDDPPVGPDPRDVPRLLRPNLERRRFSEVADVVTRGRHRVGDAQAI